MYKRNFILWILLASNITALVMLGLNRSFAQANKDEATTITHLSGDSRAVWIGTSKNSVVYCWWEGDIDRKQNRAKCNELRRWNVDLKR